MGPSLFGAPFSGGPKNASSIAGTKNELAQVVFCHVRNETVKETLLALCLSWITNLCSRPMSLKILAAILLNPRIQPGPLVRLPYE